MKYYVIVAKGSKAEANPKRAFPWFSSKDAAQKMLDAMPKPYPRLILEVEK